MKSYRFPWISLLILLVVSEAPRIYSIVTGLSSLPYDEMIYKGLYINCLLAYLPLTYAILSFVYGLKRGFHWWIPLLFSLAFLPNIVEEFLVTHSGGMEVYLQIYLVISVLFLGIGSVVGYLLKKAKKSS